MEEHHEEQQYRLYSASLSEYGDALFHREQPQQQQHDAFAWQHGGQQQHQHHSMAVAATTSSVDPRMAMLAANLDPLPIQRSSSTDNQRASVSIEDEIFEARMLQEALRDCDATPAVPTHPSQAADSQHEFHQHHQHQQRTSPMFHPQSFQAQLMYMPHFATVTPPGSAVPRGSISQQYPSIHAVSPVENLRSYSIMSSQPLSGTSPSSFSSNSSARSSVTGLSSLQGSPPPASNSGIAGSASDGQTQPKKRVQTARICHIEGCTRGIRSRGLCKAHGGGRRCTTPGCTTSDQGGGHCVLHGGGRRCRIEGCMKSAQWRGVCKLHGGARRCRYGNCTKNGQVKQGYCRLHYNLLTQQRLQGQLAMPTQAGLDEGEEKQHELEEEKKTDVTDPFSHTLP
ncbi:hypothetical protein PybrP1_008373 [[Pythium] brassicae (nom. inval.)]|nr:hypothetical protein PybrP1_008373 [[Pythium] brassicae (nom. inval.)]